MNMAPSALALVMVLAFSSGFLTHVLYQRWKTPDRETGALVRSRTEENPAFEPRNHRVTFEPLVKPGSSPAELPHVETRDLEQIRSLAGQQARIRGRVFRVGHSAKSNTFFINFGPSREAFTAVIFASAVPLFEKAKLQPKNYEGKEVEVAGVIKEHPQYGLEIIVENPSQIRVINQ